MENLSYASTESFFSSTLSSTPPLYQSFLRQTTTAKAIKLKFSFSSYNLIASKLNENNRNRQ